MFQPVLNISGILEDLEQAHGVPPCSQSIAFDAAKKTREILCDRVMYGQYLALQGTGTGNKNFHVSELEPYIFFPRKCLLMSILEYR